MTGDEGFIHLLKSRLLIRPPINADPRTLRPSLKNLIIIIISLSGAMPGFSSTIYFPGIPIINEELHAPTIATTLTAALFILFMGIAPVFWAAFSDFYMIRRFWLIVTMVIFIASSLGNALVSNIWGMVALRCVQAIGASSGQAIGGGVIADLFPVEQRGAAYGKFFLGMIIGPIIGPIIGGFLIMSDLTWRTTFWFCFAFGAFVLIIMFFFLPETYRDDKRWNTGSLPTTSPLTDDSRSTAGSETISIHPANATGEKRVQSQEVIPLPEKPKEALNPIRPFLLVRYPHIMLSSLVGGIAFGSMFAIETAMSTILEENYGFNSWQIGLCFLGGGFGHVFGAIVNGMLSDRLLLHARSKRGGRHKAEDRLAINLWPCCLIFMPLGLLLFGWGMETHMSYWTAIIGFGIQTFAMNQIMTTTSAYLLDAAPGIGASASAAGNLVRMVLACGLTVATTPMIEKIGPGYLSVFLAALSWFSAVLLFINKVYGHRIRRYYGLEQEAERKQ